MLQNIRDKAQGWLAWTIIGLIAFTFVLWGVGNHFSSNPGTEAAATVNGDKITWNQVDTLYERLQRQQSYRNPEAEIDTQLLKQTALQNLINNLVLTQKVVKSGFGVSNEQLSQIITGLPEFQENGIFSPAKFAQLIHTFGYSEKSFFDELRANILINQLQQGIVETNFTIPHEMANFVHFIDQKRDISYAIIPGSLFDKNVTISDAAVQKYYDAHKEEYMTEPKVSLDYILLNANDLGQNIKPTEGDLKQYYQKNLRQFSEPEQLKVAHILVALPEKPTEEQSKAANEKLALLKKDLQAGKDFADLAKQYSDDAVSAKKGGELAEFTKGEMIPEFEKAAFELKKSGQISEPVRSSFGIHLIKLIAHTPSKQISFESVRDKIAELYQKNKAEEQLAQIGDEVTTLAFEHPDTLQPIADKFNIKIKSSPMFSESSPIDIFKNPKLLKVAFSEDLVTERHNSDLIKIDDNVYIVMRVADYEASKQKTLEQVKGEIAKELKTQEEEKLAKAKAEELLKLAQDGQKFANLAQQNNLIVKSQSGLSRKAVEQSRYIAVGSLGVDPLIAQKAFALPKIENPVGMVALHNGDYAIVRVDKITDGSIDVLAAQDKESYQQGLAASLGQIEFNLYVSNAIASSEIKHEKESKRRAQVVTESEVDEE